MSIGIFQLVKNEAMWVGAWLERLCPHVAEVVIFDGNSTDGTLEIIGHMQGKYPGKIRLYTNQDCANLMDDYVRLFNECLQTLNTDWAYFAHPDMLVENPERLVELGKMDGVAMSVNMRSFAGEPDGEWYEIHGRATKWKSIFRLRGPDLGAHYFGHYGAQNEDVYFREITGDEHEHHGEDFKKYPYEVIDSGLNVLHFSDVRPYARRLDRMIKCLLNQGYSGVEAHALAPTHPRVTFKDGSGMTFSPFYSVPIRHEIAQINEKVMESQCPA